MKYAYFVVEGQHDIAAIGKILKIKGLELVKIMDKLDSYWVESNIIPTTFPHEKDLLKRVPVPFFYQSEELSIAIHAATSDTNLVETLSLSLPDMDLMQLSAVAIFCDADKMSAEERFNQVLGDIRADLEVDEVKKVFLSERAGQVYEGRGLRTGVYVFPDNLNQGNLENLLLNCASISYEELYQRVEDYVKFVRDTDKSLGKKKYTKEWTTSSDKKAMVGCIANALRPGAANQVSIQHDDWICEETIKQLDSVKMLYTFIDELIKF